MFRIAKKSLAIVIISILLVAPFASNALAVEYVVKKEPSGGMMMLDLAVIRPFSILATAVGSVFYLASLPFSLSGGNADEAGQELVAKPAAYTFTRPLGRDLTPREGTKRLSIKSSNY